MTTPSFATLHIDVDGPIGRLRLDRPDRLNALSPEMLVELAEAARWFDRQRDVKVVVVSGAGRAFCAGFDLTRFAGATDEPASPRELPELGRYMAEAVTAMRALTIASTHGHVVGGGVVLVAACDLRVAADDTRFSIPEVDLGIPLAWGGIPRLVREIGPALTKELVLTCRPFDAEEARAVRFVNRVVPRAELDAATDALARELAAKSALTLYVTKQQVNAVVEEMGSTLRSVNDADALVSAMRDRESRAVGAAYLERRARR